MNDSPPLVPAKGAPGTAAVRFLGLKPTASDARAHAVIHRWMERDDPRFEEYYDRFVEPFEPITRERIAVSPARYRWIVSWQQYPLYGLVPYEAIPPVARAALIEAFLCSTTGVGSR